jgi:sugar O-acyltransferase (sialic acid O-acetyltransferase NeuD family)
MTELLLVDASGLARDVMSAVRSGDQFDLLGLLDGDASRIGTVLDGAHVLGGIEDVGRYPSARIVVCATSGTARADLVRRLVEAGVTADRFATILHPSASIPEGCFVGPGSIVLANAVMTAAVHVGSHVVIMPQVTLMDGDTIEDFATVGAGATLGGSVSVGRAAEIGMNSSVHHHVRIGAQATVGIGAVVAADIPEAQG